MKDIMLEKTIEQAVCIYAKQKSMIPYKFTSPSNRGVCDRIVISDGYVFFIEFKRKGCLPTVLQNRHHQILVNKGLTVYVIDDIDIGKGIIDYEYENKGSRHHWRAVRKIGCD
jgi:hypothetical protein